MYVCNNEQEYGKHHAEYQINSNELEQTQNKNTVYATSATIVTWKLNAGWSTHCTLFLFGMHKTYLRYISLAYFKPETHEIRLVSI